MANIITDIQLSGITYQIQGDITVDPTLDSGSTNPVANSAITTALDDKQATLVSSQNIKTINNQSLLGSGNIDIQGGGGKAIEAGRGITVTSGETADTVSFNLPISGGTGANSIIEGNDTTASGRYSHAEGNSTRANGDYSHAEGNSTRANGTNSHAEGSNTTATSEDSHSEGHHTKASGVYGSHAEGRYTIASGVASHAEGYYTEAKNNAEHASGWYNVSSSASTTFGDSGNTLFSVGNGTSTSARHNAFEIRQNGDIYLTLDGQDVKLQDHLGGGGGLTEDDELLLSTALTDLNDRKIDASEVKSNYQKKGDYATKYYVATALEPYETKENVEQVEEVTAYALNDLNNRFGGLKIVKITESEYAALATKDENTLYIVVADPS